MAQVSWPTRCSRADSFASKSATAASTAGATSDAAIEANFGSPGGGGHRPLLSPAVAVSYTAPLCTWMLHAEMECAGVVARHGAAMLRARSRRAVATTERCMVALCPTTAARLASMHERCSEHWKLADIGGYNEDERGQAVCVPACGRRVCGVEVGTAMQLFMTCHASSKWI